MKYAQLLSLSLVVFTLFGCNQTSTTNQVDDTVEAVTPQQAANDEDSSPPQITNKVNPSPQKIAQNKPSSNSSEKGIIDETSYDTALKSLNSLTKGCQETKKTPEGTNTNYSICKLDGKTVKASASSSVAGDGNEYWFVDNRVIAVQQFHTSELFIYDNNGKLKSKFNYPKKATSISNQDRQEAKRLYNGYDYIFEVFNNNSTAKAPSSKYGTLEELNAKIKKRNGRIIGSATCDGDGLENDVRVDYNGDGMPDECVTANLKIEHPIINENSFQTVTSSLQSLAKGCEESKKTQGNFVKTICRKDGEIVKASESHAEFGDGIGYWFSKNRVVAVQRFHNGETFIYYRNGELSSKFADNLKTGKTEKITNFNNEQIQEADKLISGYQDILQAFGIN
jgi:hypothetical protein